MATMIDAVRRNTALVLGVAICGMIFTLASPAMRMSTGAPGPSILQAESPAVAILAVLGCMVMAVVIACVVGKVVNTAVGLFVLGAGVFILANRGGSLTHLVSANGSMNVVVIEVVLWALLVLVATLAVFRVAGPLTDVEPDEFNRRPHWLLSKSAAISAGAGVLVLPVVWAIAQTPMKGQALAAVILGAMAAGLAGRLFSPHVQPKLLFASVCVFGAIGHLVAGILEPNVHSALVARTVSAFQIPMPVDYAAGSLLGVAMGLGWAKSFLHHEENQQKLR